MSPDGGWCGHCPPRHGTESAKTYTIAGNRLYMLSLHQKKILPLTIGPIQLVLSHCCEHTRIHYSLTLSQSVSLTEKLGRLLFRYMKFLTHVPDSLLFFHSILLGTNQEGVRVPSLCHFVLFFAPVVSRTMCSFLSPATLESGTDHLCSKTMLQVSPGLFAPN